MSYGLQLNPARAPRSHRRGDWPRLYAQLIGTRDLFEIARGTETTVHVYRRLAASFGPRWRVWIETKTTPQTYPHPTDLFTDSALSTLNSQLSTPPSTPAEAASAP